MSTLDIPTEQRREQAIKRLRDRSDFWTHLTAYVLINAVIVVTWFVVSGHGLFWPIFPALAWGIGVIFHALDVFRRPPSEERIRREMERLS